jgi:hypothetical protein
MEDVDFSDEFCRFVQAHVPSVDVAEALLAQYRLNNTVRAPGFSDEEIARHLATLAQAYEERPVTLVRLIYALRDRKIRSFADAFKLRKD